MVYELEQVLIVTFFQMKKAAVVVSVTCPEAMLALCFSTLLVMCLMKRLGQHLGKLLSTI